MHGMKKVEVPNYDVVALVLQGGGALGAYQAGVYQGLHEAGIRPNWLAGISIGALNAAVIAGAPEAERVERLRDFWQTICAMHLHSPAHDDFLGGAPGNFWDDFRSGLPFAFAFRPVHNAMAAMLALTMGQN